MLPDAEQTMEVTVAEVAGWIDLPPSERPRLIGCREREGLDICRIDGAEWLPLGEFPTSLERFQGNVGRGVVVYCHHGMRSMHAAAFLRAQGVEQVFSMAGGIDAWARLVDASMDRY